MLTVGIRKHGSVHTALPTEFAQSAVSPRLLEASSQDRLTLPSHAASKFDASLGPFLIKHEPLLIAIMAMEQPGRIKELKGFPGVGQVFLVVQGIERT